MKAEVGKTYIIYGKMKQMRKFKPLGPHTFVSNLIHSVMYTPKDKSDCDKLDLEIEFLNNMNDGVFELRERE